MDSVNIVNFLITLDIAVIVGLSIWILNLLRENKFLKIENAELHRRIDDLERWSENDR